VITISDASLQNALAERFYYMFGDMMRTMFHGAGIDNTYWSYALFHPVYAKYRLSHKPISTTPYKTFTGTKSGLSHLRVFGRYVSSKLPGDCNI